MLLVLAMDAVRANDLRNSSSDWKGALVCGYFGFFLKCMKGVSSLMTLIFLKMMGLFHSVIFLVSRFLVFGSRTMSNFSLWLKVIFGGNLKIFEPDVFS